MSKMNIAVIFGSRSCEHDVSIISALQLIEAAKTAGYAVTPVYISREGLWYTGDALMDIETFREFNPMGKGITRVNLDVSANAGDLWAWPPQRAGLFAKVPAPVAHIDCAIPVMHGLHGEDGTLQGLLEMANIPYASSGVLGSAVGMDKIAMKQMLRGEGFPVLDFVWFTRDQLKLEREAIIEKIEKKFNVTINNNFNKAYPARAAARSWKRRSTWRLPMTAASSSRSASTTLWRSTALRWAMART